jgi:hypothetical protein
MKYSNNIYNTISNDEFDKLYLNNINEIVKLKRNVVKKDFQNISFLKLKKKFFHIFNNKNNKLIVFIFFFILIKVFLKYSILNNYNKNNNIKVCICAIGKNENLYIKEFVNHYKKLGYNSIFLYDNNDIGEERFEDVIQSEINDGFVVLINYRGYKGKEQNPQFDAYKDCYEKNNNNYNWLSFFDIDEYLQFNPINLKIQDFLKQKKFHLCQIIKINWLYYINNNSLYYEKKPLEERLDIPLFNISVNGHIKSTVRGKLVHNYWYKAQNPHTSINNFTTCSSSGKIIDPSSPYNYPYEHQFAYLKHYQMKSFEEYCMKIRRGRPIPGYKKYREKAIYNLLKSNENNKQKLDIIKKIFNITFNSFNKSIYFLNNM